MNKLFTYGCSFTKFEWSTWADIVGSTFPEHINYGRTGAGNHYIFNHVMQSIAKKEITKNDTVIVCWSGIDREDRFYKNKWLVGGTIYNNKYYDETYIKKYFDIEGAYIRDLAYLAATYETLKASGASFIFISMMDMDIVRDEPYTEQVRELLPWTKTSATKTYKKMYKDYTNQIRNSFHNVIFRYDWYSRSLDVKWEGYNDNWLDQYSLCAGEDWPSIDALKNERWNEFKKPVQEEIIEKFGFDSFEIFKLSRRWSRFDLHPTPLMHLEYVKKILPEFNIDEKTIEKIRNEDSTLPKQPA